MKELFKNPTILRYASLFFLIGQVANAVELRWDNASQAQSVAVTSGGGGGPYVLSPEHPVVNIPSRDDVSLLPTFADGIVAHQQRHLMLTVSGVYSVRITGDQNNYEVITTHHD